MLISTIWKNFQNEIFEKFFQIVKFIYIKEIFLHLKKAIIILRKFFQIVKFIYIKEIFPF